MLIGDKQFPSKVVFFRHFTRQDLSGESPRIAETLPETGEIDRSTVSLFSVLSSAGPSEMLSSMADLLSTATFLLSEANWTTLDIFLSKTNFAVFHISMHEMSELSNYLQ